MSDDVKRIFAENLSRLIEMCGKQPADIVKDLGIPCSTLSEWLNGKKFPRMNKVVMLAEYLGCDVSDLVQDKGIDSIPEKYYLDDDARELAQFMFRSPEYKVLFDSVRKVRPEDIEFVRRLLDAANKGNE